MNGWWIVLAGLGFLTVWGLAAAYRREAEENAEPDDMETSS